MKYSKPETPALKVLGLGITDAQRKEWKDKRKAARDRQEKFEAEVEQEYQRLRELDATPSQRRWISIDNFFERLARIIAGTAIACVVAYVCIANGPSDLGDRAIGSLTLKEIFSAIIWSVGLLAGIALAIWVASGELPSRERAGPERQEDKRHAFAWVPFGGGAHMCIGQHFATLQVKAIMHQLLLRYRWSIAPGYVMPQQLVPIAKPKDGLHVTLQRIV
jgi:Cytochrome P450